MDPPGGQHTLEQHVADWIGAGARADLAHEAVAYLSSAQQLERPELFSSYCVWRNGFDREHGAPDRLVAELDSLATLPGLGHTALAIVEHARAELGSIQLAAAEPRRDPVHSALADDYLSDLLAGERHRATQRILDAVEGGLGIRDLYLSVFEPVLAEVGYRWETGQIPIGQEHFITAVTQSIMAQLFPHIFSSSLKSHRLVATSVAGNLHEIGIRMVADLFELAGWDTHYLGADMPVDAIVESLRALEPDALALSVMLTSQIPAAAETISAVRADPELAELFVMLGGRAVRLEPNLAARLGADAWAVGPDEAAAMLDRMLERR